MLIDESLPKCRICLVRNRMFIIIEFIDKHSHGYLGTQRIIYTIYLSIIEVTPVHRCRICSQLILIIYIQLCLVLYIFDQCNNIHATIIVIATQTISAIVLLIVLDYCF